MPHVRCACVLALFSLIGTVRACARPTLAELNRWAGRDYQTLSEPNKRAFEAFAKEIIDSWVPPLGSTGFSKSQNAYVWRLDRRDGGFLALIPTHIASSGKPVLTLNIFERDGIEDMCSEPPLDLRSASYEPIPELGRKALILRATGDPVLAPAAATVYYIFDKSEPLVFRILDRLGQPLKVAEWGAFYRYFPARPARTSDLISALTGTNDASRLCALTMLAVEEGAPWLSGADYPEGSVLRKQIRFIRAHGSSYERELADQIRT